MVSSALFRADLHCHSNYSDGSHTPLELIQLAVDKGLQGLSITDHDSIDAYLEQKLLTQELPIKLLSGVELSTTIEKKSVHILAYAFNVKNKEITNLCTTLREKRTQRNIEILEKLKKINIIITESELKEKFTQRSIGRPHIARLLVEKNYCNSINSAFDKLIGEKAPCYVAEDKVSITTAINAIHAANGYAILAHPHYIKNKKILKKVLTFPFDGIEAYHSLSTYAQEIPWIETARSKNWIITGGSDFHGLEEKKPLQLGSSWTNQESFDKLYMRMQENLG